MGAAWQGAGYGIVRRDESRASAGKSGVFPGQYRGWLSAGDAARKAIYLLLEYSGALSGILRDWAIPTENIQK